jgi:hypothetical protein
MDIWVLFGQGYVPCNILFISKFCRGYNKWFGKYLKNFFSPENSEENENSFSIQCIYIYQAVGLTLQSCFVN